MVPGSNTVLSVVGRCAFATATIGSALVAVTTAALSCFCSERRGRMPRRRRPTSTTAKTTPIRVTLLVDMGATGGAVSTSGVVVAFGVAGPASGGAVVLGGGVAAGGAVTASSVATLGAGKII